MSAKPWYTSPAKDSSKLCQTCAHINFEWLLKNDFNIARYKHWQINRFNPVEEDVPPIKIPWVSEHGLFHFPDLSLGFLFEILERSEHCGFCRLVSFTIAVAYGIEPEILSKHDFQHTPYHLVFCTLSNSKREDLFGGMYDLTIEICNAKKSFMSFEQVLLHQIKDDITMPFSGRFVSSCIDFLAIKRWLASFRSSVPRNAAVPGFRLIDVVHSSVVPVHGPGLCRYLCLSYVWGGPQKFQNVRAVEKDLQEPGSLLHRQLPKTIEDAIAFTARSGERYLWVDSLCIVQDDGEAKMAQIDAMDQIYSCALATIIHSDGISCHTGLPGVGNATRTWKQHSVDVRGIILANRYQNAFAKKEHYWNTRGWTFQEHALSRRCIHVGLGALTFESEDGITEEDMQFPPHKPRLKWTHTGFPVGDSLPAVATLSNIQIFAFSILMYSPRSLTFDTDAINAFQGVLNIHRPRFRRDFIYAMPSSELELALLWQPASVLNRRSSLGDGQYPFPSWSWVAWKGGLIIPVEGAARFSRVTWVDALGMKKEFTSDEWRGAQSTSWQIVPGRSLQLAPWYFEESDPDTRFAHPISEDIPPKLMQYQFLKPDNHQLTFYALRARVSSVLSQRSLEKPLDVNATAPEGVQSRSLQDRFGRFCGIVYLHAVNLELNTDSLDCVAISRTAIGPNNASHDHPPVDDSDVVSIQDDYDKRAMLRKKSDERTAANYFDVYEFELKWQAYDILVIAQGLDGISERVGVGFCLCEAFWDAKPVRERIQLR